MIPHHLDVVNTYRLIANLSKNMLCSVHISARTQVIGRDLVRLGINIVLDAQTTFAFAQCVAIGTMKRPFQVGDVRRIVRRKWSHTPETEVASGASVF